MCKYQIQNKNEVFSRMKLPCTNSMAGGLAKKINSEGDQLFSSEMAKGGPRRGLPTVSCNHVTSTIKQ